MTIKLGDPDLKNHVTNLKGVSWHGADLKGVENLTSASMPGEKDLKGNIDKEQSSSLLKSLLNKIIHPKDENKGISK